MVSGTAGFAFAFVVWYGFPRSRAPDAFSLSIPEGWTFEQSAKAIAANDSAVAEFHGFTPAQLAAPLPSASLQSETPEEAMRALGHLAVPGAVPAYQVSFHRPCYTLKAISVRGRQEVS